MYKAHIYQHISPQLFGELENLRRQVLTMGGLVEQQIADALEALRNMDIILGDQVIKEDIKVNKLETDIDEASLQILTQKSLQASDARVLITIVKIINELERIGDEAQRIGQMVNYIVKEGNTQIFSRISLQYLGGFTLKMLHDALDAFARLHAKAAIEIAKKDAIVDQEYSSLLQKLQNVMQEEHELIPAAVHVLWSIRAIERIGDHTRNICEHIIYLIYGKSIRHLSLEDIESHLNLDSNSINGNSKR